NANLLLFEVRMEEQRVAEAMTAYRIDGTLYFPLGELSSLAGIAIQTRPQEGVASGFILNPAHRFSLNVRSLHYTLGGQSGSFPASAILLRDDDIYVSRSLLEHWLPL